eukprot:CAMPEP_0194480404 /NCGR_PEP_ID=MMETSP0253-20130528/3209_1 /TAXON_ID=2966 /ORGANISM="Noctiluca scintillans" /LENGTH=166 /DNA_ID=CAMNT_0039319779 /DNA_START=52 /DNA_END=552 /DNA_ORIENTATION=-
MELAAHGSHPVACLRLGAAQASLIHSRSAVIAATITMGTQIRSIPQSLVTRAPKQNLQGSMLQNGASHAAGTLATALGARATSEPRSKPQVQQGQRKCRDRLVQGVLVSGGVWGCSVQAPSLTPEPAAVESTAPSPAASTVPWWVASEQAFWDQTRTVEAVVFSRE